MVNDKDAEILRLEKALHEHRCHPDFEYAMTVCGRKQEPPDPPDGEGWEENGWERFSFHEEHHWRRLISVMKCEMCGEDVSPTDPKPQHAELTVHVECLFRNVIGGIGHHEDHGRWCIEEQDPDGGRTRRQSALEVWALFHKRGLQ